jgi:hypothetical protein
MLPHRSSCFGDEGRTREPARPRSLYRTIYISIRTTGARTPCSSRQKSLKRGWIAALLARELARFSCVCFNDRYHQVLHHL